MASTLADELRAGGSIRSEVWADAVREVPRHELVREFYRTDDGFRWYSPRLTELERLAEVYRDQTLVTGLTDHPLPDELGGGAYQTATSSSTLPSLMFTMLEALDIHDGYRVLEVGTGTGYNAALVCHRVGDANVTSVDLDPALVDLARERLASIGYRPTLAAVDGTAGWPGGAPYDRIITTCSVPAIPTAWVDQLADDGLLLADIQGSLYAGNLVLLRKSGPGTATGRFLGGNAGFMPARQSLTDEPSGPPRAGSGPASIRHTTAGPGIVADRTSPAAMLAQLMLPDGTILTGNTDDGGHEHFSLTAPDRSRARISAKDDAYEVTESGPSHLWAAVEAADRIWRENGQPEWERFGLTVTPDSQWVWLDNPSQPVRP